MTGTVQHPEPQSAPTPAPGTDRRGARNEARLALIRWFDTLHTDLAALLDNAGVHGDHRAIAFTTGVDHAADHTDDGPHWRETLRSAQLIGFGNEVTLVPGTTNDLWPTAVELWLDLLDCLATYSAEQLPPGLLVDLDTRTIGAWYPYYCPDQGNLPEALLVVPTVDDAITGADPFTELLLEDPDDEEDEALDNLTAILEMHDLEPPSTPAHDPGDCDLPDDVDPDDAD